MELPTSPHTAIVTGATGCGKTYFIMDLLANGYYKDFYDAVVVLCPTFHNNDTYQKHIDLFTRFPTDNEETHFYFFDFPKHGLYSFDPKHYGKKEISLPEALKFYSDIFNKDCDKSNVLFIVDDFAGDVELSRKKTYLTTMAISGRHCNQSMWVLTQKYNMLCKDVRSQAKWVCSFYTQDRKSFEEMLDQHNIGMSKDIKEKVKIHCLKGGSIILNCCIGNLSYALLDNW